MHIQSRGWLPALVLCLAGSFGTGWAQAADTAGQGAPAPMSFGAKQSPANSVLEAAPQTAWVAQGLGRRIIYIFFDPNCPYCHRLYTDLRPLIKPYDLTLRWIPVGILTATSRGKAAAILDAKDPAKALDYNEVHYSMNTHSGGIAEDIPSPKTLARLRVNAALLQRTGMSVVPTMVFRAKNGKAILVQGAPPPKDLKKILDTVR